MAESRTRRRQRYALRGAGAQVGIESDFPQHQDHPDFIQLKLPGYYEIRSNKKTDWVAVNTPPEESDLTGVSLEEFQAVFVPREARVAESSLEASVLERDRQQSLWWLLLIVACLVFMAEWWVANRSRSASLHPGGWQENTGL